MFGTDALYERPTLLELSERGSMKPYILSRRVHLSLQRFYRLTLTTPHLTHLLVENTGNGNANEVDIDTEIIHYDSVLGVNVNVSINYYFSTSIDVFKSNIFSTFILKITPFAPSILFSVSGFSNAFLVASSILLSPSASPIPMYE